MENHEIVLDLSSVSVKYKSNLKNIEIIDYGGNK